MNADLNHILQELREAPRLAGTPACDLACERLADRFRTIGYEANIIGFTFVGWSVPEPPQVVDIESGEVYPSRAATWCGGTAGVQVQGVVKRAGSFESWGLGSDRKFDRWAIIDAGADCGTAYLVGNIEDHLVLPYPMEDVAYVCMDPRTIERLAESARRIQITMRAQLRFGAASSNLTALKKGNNESEIIVCAHHDTVYDDSEGLHDNGGACAVLILLADYFGNIETNHSIRFLSTGGEEFNMVGSRSYLNMRERHGTLSKLKACINIDYITQPPRRVHVRCTEEFDGIVHETINAHREPAFPYDLDESFSRDLACLDAFAFAEREIPSFWYVPYDSNRHDESINDFSQNIVRNARFLRDVILAADRSFT